uniref:Uncharacterized protein n=1 Tax=Haemonchus placei TaxID=6290 RepID=A0A0N4X840_HAEPC
MIKFDCNFLKCSRHRFSLLAIRQEKNVLVNQADEHFYILCLAIEGLCESVNVSLATARPEFLIKTVIMNRLPRSNDLLRLFPCYLEALPVVNYLFDKKCVALLFLPTYFLSDMVRQQPCLLVNLSPYRLGHAELRSRYEASAAPFQVSSKIVTVPAASIGRTDITTHRLTTEFELFFKKKLWGKTETKTHK